MNDDVKKAIETHGKFTQLREINEGANAYAFVATHTHLQEERFLKAIYLPELENESVLREPRTLISALATKPVSGNIVRLHDADIIKVRGDDYVLLQMEYLTGSSLQTLIETRVFGQQESILLASQILSGIAHLHSQRLVHRDLKPGNIILHVGVAKIADFGSVSKLAPGVDFVTASRHSDLYMPVEGWRNPPRFTFSSDLYQLGLVLYQLINGPFPLNGKHYLTKAVSRGLREAGKDYVDLDDFEKCKAERASFDELVSSEKLLSTALAPRVYYSPSIDKLIRKVTRANVDQRFLTANELLHKIAQISTPDWKPEADSFVANAWKRWDWRVRQVKRKHGIEAIVEKSQPTSDSFRRCHAASTLLSAFRFVDSQV